MPDRRTIWILLLLAATIAGMTWAASVPLRTPSIVIAAIAFIGLALHAASVNTAAGELAPVDSHEAARANALLMALTYGWGGLAMLAVYMLTALEWRHGWQYGSGMLLIAAGLQVYARRLGDASAAIATPHHLDRMAWAALAQGAAAGVALVWLVLSGKLATPKDDWAANHIFVAGGLAIVVISLMSFNAHRRLTARRRGPA